MSRPFRAATDAAGQRARRSRLIFLPRVGRSAKAPSARNNARAFVLAYVAVNAVGTLLLSLPWTTRSGEATPFIDAFFTAVGFAAGGMVPVDTATHWNAVGQVVALLLIQTGGLGFAVGASLLLQMLRRGEGGGVRDALLLQDGSPALSPREAVLLSGRILRFTLGIEAIGALLLALRFWREMPLPRALWYGLFHAVSAFCNAGFDLQGNFSSLTAYRTSIWMNVVFLALVQAGALSYIVFADVNAGRRWSRFALDTKLVLLMNALLLAVGVVVFLAAEWDRGLAGTPAWAKPMVALFQSAAVRTSGFATIDFGRLGAFTLFVCVALMFVGGASGSTTGGVKLATVGVVGTAILATLRGQEEPQLFGRRLATPLVFRAMTIIALLLLAHFAATLALAWTEDRWGRNPSFIAVMFEAMSALATDGHSTGITTTLSSPGKLVLCAAMILGKVGPLTAAYALQQRQHRARHRFPQARVRIG